MIDNLPSDPIILLSYINTKLRDNYPSLQELCYDLNVSQKDVETKLMSIGYSYNPALNKFV